MKLYPHNDMIEVEKVRVVTESAYKLLEGVPIDNEGLPDRFVACTTEDVPEWKDKVLLVPPYDVYTFSITSTTGDRFIKMINKGAVYAVIELDPDVITIGAEEVTKANKNRKY